MEYEQSRTDLREAWKKTLKRQDTRYHLTITFPANTPQRETRRLLNRFIRHLNRKIYNRHYKRGTAFLRGYAVEEYTHSFNTYHYHIAIADHEYLPNKDELDAIIRKQLLIFNGQHLCTDRSLETQYKTELRLQQTENDVLRAIINKPSRELKQRKKKNYIETYLLQDYYDDGVKSLEHYVTKNFELYSFTLDEVSASIGLLSERDVLFGDYIP